MTRLEVATGSSFPGNLALGVVDDVGVTAEVGAAIGSLCARAGVNLDLAPCADVNSNPDNPVIGVRSFGADPALVARHVRAFVEGLQRCHVAACAKHFPGHGDTAQDSHHELPRAEGDLEAALLPFRAAIDAGAKSIMTAHIVVPSLDEAPATLSPRILHGAAARRARLRRPGGHGRARDARRRRTRSAWRRARCGRSRPAPTLSASATTSPTSPWRASAGR